MITDRLSALFKWCRNKLKNDVLPAVADNWYALRHHNGSVCSCFSKGRNTDDDEEEGDEEQENEASLEYRTKVPIKWNQRDVVSFICHEVTMGDVKEFRICRLCKENDVDGTSIIATWPILALIQFQCASSGKKLEA